HHDLDEVPLHEDGVEADTEQGHGGQLVDDDHRVGASGPAPAPPSSSSSSLQSWPMPSTPKTTRASPVPTSTSSLTEKACSSPPERIVWTFPRGRKLAVNEPLATSPPRPSTMMASAPASSTGSITSGLRSGSTLR